jgi:3',5'-nucleoside bisphosphate phosphatase
MATLITVAADLHVHTVASACAEVEMIPPLIVRRAVELGLQVIGVTDHHSVENVQAVAQAAQPYGIRVFPGMEIQTREEVHVLCLFEGIDQALAWQAVAWDHLPAQKNREEFFGPQYVVDFEGEYIRTNDRLLQSSLDLGFEEALKRVEDSGGLALPAHVDKSRYSLFANLGLIPLGCRLSGAEISRHVTAEDARGRFPQLAQLGLVQSGDAHRLEEMISTTALVVERRTLAELRLALRGEAGRRVLLSKPA